MTTSAVAAGVVELRDRIRDAAASSTPLRIVGRSTWLDAGRPADAIETISTRELSGIVAYVPGDLTLTARAGTTLAEVRDATAEHNQWLALDPHGVDDGTIGATAATASAGPLATHFGTPRDLVLGVEFIAGTASVARGGGRVVKNVAGFDLTRLMIGAWGTLGVITEVTVRLHARPEVDLSMAIDLEDRPIEHVRQTLNRFPFKPFACEVLNAPLAESMLGMSSNVVLLRLAGNAEAVKLQRAAIAMLGAARECSHDVWAKLRDADRGSATVVRYSALPNRVAESWDVASQMHGARIHASPTRGIVRALADGNSLPASSDGVTRIAERVPGAQWSEFPSVDTALTRRMKKTFDPANVLNRGMAETLA